MQQRPFGGSCVAAASQKSRAPEERGRANATAAVEPDPVS